jgi:hypothetical protein
MTNIEQFSIAIGLSQTPTRGEMYPPYHLFRG